MQELRAELEDDVVLGVDMSETDRILRDPRIAVHLHTEARELIGERGPSPAERDPYR